jgi:glucan phosphoethanolaminetransferase (alkaline phosphatase superfamily)
MNADPEGFEGAEVDEAEDDSSWSRRLWLGAVLVVLLLIGGLIASATVPRWWAQRVGDQVNGSITQGVLVGLFYGFVFTLLPLLILALVLRWRRTWKWLAAGLLLALVAAAPNLMTLGIVLGTGNAAHAGDRTLDVEAPAFRGATLAGALLAVALVLFVVYLVVTRRRERARGRDVQARLADSTAAGTEPPADDL